jgi:hypothetical protein
LGIEKEGDMADNMAKLEEAMARLAVTMEVTAERMAKSREETEQAMTKFREESDARDVRAAKLREESERAIAKIHEESAKNHDETERAIAKIHEESAKNHEEFERTLAAQNKELSEKIDKWIGHFGTNIGTLVELTLIPGIKLKMKKFGHDFDSLAPRKQYYRKDGNMLAEVDLFLENGVEVMAVEVKTQFNAPAVEYHVKRLQLLRKHDAERLKDKDILAAIAGLSVDREAEELALRLGMYVIKMVEDDKNITVIEPAGAVGKW